MLTGTVTVACNIPAHTKSTISDCAFVVAVPPTSRQCITNCIFQKAALERTIPLVIWSTRTNSFFCFIWLCDTSCSCLADSCFYHAIMLLRTVCLSIVFIPNRLMDENGKKYGERWVGNGVVGGGWLGVWKEGEGETLKRYFSVGRTCLKQCTFIIWRTFSKECYSLTVSEVRVLHVGNASNNSNNNNNNNKQMTKPGKTHSRRADSHDLQACWDIQRQDLLSEPDTELPLHGDFSVYSTYSQWKLMMLLVHCMKIE